MRGLHLAIVCAYILKSLSVGQRVSGVFISKEVAVKKMLLFLPGAVLLCALAAGAADYVLPTGVKEITTPELKALFDNNEKYVLINPLSALEFTQSKIKGAVCLPYGHLLDGSIQLPADKGGKLIFYCLGPG